MGTYVFRWPYPANDVHVTGTFDDWGKSEQLNKVGDIWEKEVTLPSADEKILYKFVVDDQWIVDESAPKEGDGHNNTNNVLYPTDIKRKELTSSAPGAFPETPSAEQTFNINPIPASSTIGNPIDLKPGEPIPSDVNKNTVDSTVTTSQADYEKSGSSVLPIGLGAGAAAATVGGIVGAHALKKPEAKEHITPESSEPTFNVNPIPASSTIGNPIDLKPGEAIPSGVNKNTVDSTVTTSQEDYEKSGSSVLPIGLGAGAAAATVGGIAGANVLKKPEAKEGIIPESSLPMGVENFESLDSGPYIMSSGPGTTTANLASKVPLEKKVDPTISSAAATSTTADLASKVPLEKPVDPTISSAAATSTTAGLASKVPLEKSIDPTISSAAATSTTADLASKVPLEKSVDPTISSVAPGTSAAALAGNVPLEQKRQGMIVDPKDLATTSVPETVQESIGKAHQDPEAAASATAVKEKSAMEKELLSKVPESEAKGETAAAAAGQTSYHGLATSVPQTVEKSMAKANAPPEAAANASIVAEKTELEQELLKKTPKSNEHGQPAPTLAAATSATAPTTADTSLADEPAVKMMKQNETSSVPPAQITTAAAGIPTITDVGTGAATKPAVTTSTPSTPVKQTTTSAAPSPTSTTGTDKSKKKHKRGFSTIIKNIFHKDKTPDSKK